MDKQPAQTRYVDKCVRCVRHMPRMRRDRVMFTRVRMRRGQNCVRVLCALRVPRMLRDCVCACVCGGVPETECACAAVHVRDTCARAVCTACACEMCVCGVRASCRMPVICRACIIGGRQMCVRVYGGFHSGQHRSDGSVRVPRVYGRLCRRGQSAWTFTASRVCVRACRASCAGYLRVATSA